MQTRFERKLKRHQEKYQQAKLKRPPSWGMSVFVLFLGFFGGGGGVCQLKLTLIIQIDAYYIHRFIQIHIPNIVNPHGNNDHLMHVVKKMLNYCLLNGNIINFVL